MKFIDRVKIHVQAGNGGRGCASFRREKFVPRGGPDGGDGGDGGDISFVVKQGMSTLSSFRHKVHYKAESGASGRGARKHGRNGASLTIEVPPGTTIFREGSDELLADLIEAGEEIILFRGGRGGRGNASLSRGRKVAYHADPGQPGEEGWLLLELKLLADVGLVGLPNAGKSTFISAVSNARPKIADYPFTTLSPQLGVVSYDDFKSFVLADIPGLIEGASLGHGLGHYFLRQIERTRIILHLLDIAVAEDRDPIADFETINRELGLYNASLLEKPQIVVFTKMDLAEARGRVERLLPYFEKHGFPVFYVSAVSGEGLRQLVQRVGAELEKLNAPPSETVVS
ncbi:MAG: GTPase ObgE [Desulfuromonadaceae bacterium]|nr:GTPase ObgE [Desulfuromonadaceae bacterium]